MLVGPRTRRLIDRTFVFAIGTSKDPALGHHCAAVRQIRFPALREAIWTKPMRGFGTACLWLQNVSHYAIPNWLQFIALTLSVPCFEASHFCFKRAYAFKLNRLLLARGDSLVQSIHDEPLKLYGLGSERLGVAQTYHCLSNLQRRLEASDGGSKLGNRHGNPPQFEGDNSSITKDSLANSPSEGGES